MAHQNPQSILKTAKQAKTKKNSREKADEGCLAFPFFFFSLFLFPISQSSCFALKFSLSDLKLKRRAEIRMRLMKARREEGFGFKEIVSKKVSV